jgi:glucan 1,3-beta-glucosidase
MPVRSADAGRLQCVSYAPFRPGQNPLEAGTHVEAAQIEEDLGRLRQITGCIRTYSIEHGVDQVPAIAQRLGIKVMLGLWLSPDRAKDRVQVDTAVALAKRFPDVVTEVIVGNEVLLRGDLSAIDLAGYIREVKAAVPCRVTYADVWEFWNRNPDLGNLVDVVTIHLLPYWEDVPIPAEKAPAHVETIRQQIVARFPGKEVMIGEVGWPSAGRMREGALPSLANQARFLGRVTANARRDNYRVNVIEAFDQPWKRQLEGTVGGHWGLFDADVRQPKFAWGAPVSNHPDWRAQAAGGVLFAALVFAAAGVASRQRGIAPPPRCWLGVALIAVVSGTMIGWAIAGVPAESLGVGGWARSLAWVLVALLAPPAAAAGIAGGVAVPSFGRVLGRADERPDDPLALGLGALLIGVTVLALQVALVLVFDPRYVDFPFAPLLAASIPFGVAAVLAAPPKGGRPAAETLAAATLAGAALYIAVNETIANWQALALCAGLAVLAFTLARLRAAPG